MAQDRYQMMDVALDAPGAKVITMSELDRVIAAFPGLVFDLDAARLLTPTPAILGRERKKGVKLAVQGAGATLVTSALVNNKRAIRMDGAVGHLLQLLQGLTSKTFTLIVIGTLAPAIRNSVVGTSRGMLSIYEGTTPIVWIRIAPSTGSLSFSTTSTIGAATVAQANLPAADVPAIFAFTRTESTGLHTININGVQAASATDPTSPNVSADKRLNIGGVDALSSTRSWFGDWPRVIAVETNVIASYPNLYAEFVALAKAEYGIA